MAKCCGTCVHWHEEYEGDPDGTFAFGACEYPVPIPFAWRYAPRERLSTGPEEGADCDCYAVRSVRLPQVTSPSQ